MTTWDEVHEKVRIANELHKKTCAALRARDAYWKANNAIWELYKVAKKRLADSIGGKDEHEALRSFLAIDAEYESMKAPEASHEWGKAHDEAIKAMASAHKLRGWIPNDGIDEPWPPKND